MKDKEEEMEDQDYEFNSSEWQGKSEDQVEGYHQQGGCVFVVFIILLVWFVAYELIKFLS